MTTKPSTYSLVAVLCLVTGATSAQYNQDDYLPRGVVGRTSFYVEEFVPNRVKIDAVAPDRRFSIDDPLQVHVSAEEMFGQPIANMPVSAYVRWMPAPFKPKGWTGFTFGDAERKFQTIELGLPEATLDADGKTSIVVSELPGKPPAALTAKVQVTVNDGGRAVTRSIDRTVDPVPYYLGLKSRAETYPRPGELSQFDVAAVNPDGNLATVDTKLSGTVYRVKWHSNLMRRGGSYDFQTHRELEKQEAINVNLTGGRATFDWTPGAVGNYLVQLSDPASQVSVSQSLYVSSGQWSDQPWSLEKPEVAELVLDKERYSAGETARLLIKSPFPGTVLFTLEQDRILSTTILQMTENTLEVPITVTEEMLPNVYAVASVIRPVRPAEQWLPHRAIGMANLPVSAGSRKLDVTVTAPEEVRPNSTLELTAELRDSLTSAPVSGDIIVWAVDEGVLSLTDFKTPAPGDFFSAARRLMVSTSDFYSSLMPDLITGAIVVSPTGGGDMDDMNRLSPVNTERVKPVILWQGPAQTNADGRLQIQWQVPQFMGRLRIMAMATEGKRFGHGDATTFVRNPVMMKEYLPRFAAPGDKFTAGFTIYNNTDNPMTPSAEIETAGLITADGDTSTTLPEIAPRSRETVYRTLSAADERAGQSTITFAASAGAESFASSVTLPIRPASPRIRESASAAIPSGETASFTLPGADFLTDTTSVTLVVGGMPTLDLAGALAFNLEYPHGCTEQIISRLLPLLHVKDLAAATDPQAFSEDGIRATIQSGIDRILMAQTSSGGLSMWMGSREPWPWVSIYGAHFLLQAEEAGYQVNPDYKLALLDYLASEVADTSGLSDDNRDFAEVVYANYVLASAGRQVHQSLGALRQHLDKMRVEPRALLASSYLALGLDQEARLILGETTDPRGDVTSVTRNSGTTLASPIRETAIMLMTCLDVDPGSARTADLVRRLHSLRGEKDHWGTTQDNAFVLVALGRYAAAQAQADPVSGTVTVAGATHDFSTSEPIRLDAADLAGGQVQIRSQSGTAYAWYRVDGVPIAPPARAVQQGIGLEKGYLDRDGNPVDTSALTEGQLVVVELKLSGKRELSNVVIQDLLPAGLEIENPRLSSSESVYEAEFDSSISVNHTDMRDDRIIIYADLFKPEEEYQVYRYTARAVSPGEYALPPAMFEVMYNPEISARTAPGRMTILSRKP